MIETKRLVDVYPTIYIYFTNFLYIWNLCEINICEIYEIR